MEDTVEGLGNRLAAAFRKSAADQARAYRDYSALLDRFAKKDIKAVEFGRSALDLYIGAVSDWLSTSANAAGDTLDTGLKRVGIGRTKAEAVVETAVKTAETDLAGAQAKRIRKP